MNIDSYKEELTKWINEGVEWMSRGKELLERTQKGNSNLSTCTICGINYMPKRDDSIYCSNACKQKAKRLKKMEGSVCGSSSKFEDCEHVSQSADDHVSDSLRS